MPGGETHVFEPIPDRYIEKRTARFWAYVDRSGGLDACWPWHGSQGRDINWGTPLDYGAASWRGSPTGAHRVAWMLANGYEIPGAPAVDHLCEVKWCVNGYNHLEVVTFSENTRRQKRRTPEDTRTPTSFKPPWDDRWYPFGRRLYDADGERLETGTLPDDGRPEISAVTQRATTQPPYTAPQVGSAQRPRPRIAELASDYEGPRPPRPKMIGTPPRNVL